MGDTKTGGEVMNGIEKFGFIFTVIIYFFLPPIVSSIWYLLGNETVDVLWAGTLAFLWLLVGLRIYYKYKEIKESKAVK